MKIRGKNIVDKDMIINQKSKFPFLRKIELVDRLNILSDHFNIKQKYKVNELEPDTFMISK
jgi:hypothetical protein